MPERFNSTSAPNIDVGNPPRDLTVDKLVRLIRRATLPCTKAGGRFGEDACGRCPNCQLRAVR